MREEDETEMIELSVVFHRETLMGVQVSDDGTNEHAVWLPKSQIEYMLRGKSMMLTLPEWLARDKGLI